MCAKALVEEKEEEVEEETGRCKKLFHGKLS
jgi:hypothetical protein